MPYLVISQMGPSCCPLLTPWGSAREYGVAESARRGSKGAPNGDETPEVTFIIYSVQILSDIYPYIYSLVV